MRSLIKNKWIIGIFCTIIAGLIIILIQYLYLAGNLEGIRGDFSSLPWKEGYKIVCNFKIKNKGILSVDSEKIQLEIPEYAEIIDIIIKPDYRHLYTLVDGGKGENFAVFKVEGLDRKDSIKGTVTFFQNKSWSEDLSPIFFSE